MTKFSKSEMFKVLVNSEYEILFNQLKAEGTGFF